MENFLSAIIWDVPTVSPGQCKVMIPNELRKAWVQAEELGLDHCYPKQLLGLEMGKSLLCCSGSSGHLETPIFCPGGYSEVCVLHIHSLFSLAIYFFPWLPFLHVEDADFPPPTTPSYWLFFPPYFQSLFVSPDMWMIQGSSGGGKLGNVCVVGMLSRTFSKTNVRFDTNKCRG